MRVREISLGAKRTRPGPVAYSSDVVETHVVIELSEGDTPEAVLVEARRVVALALDGQAPVTEHREQAASAPPQPNPDMWTVRITGMRPKNPFAKHHKLQFRNGELVAEYQRQGDAEHLAKAAMLIANGVKVTVDPPTRKGDA